MIPHRPLLAVLAPLLVPLVLFGCSGGSSGSASSGGGGGSSGGPPGDGGGGSNDCEPPPAATITIALPKLGLPPDEEGLGWTRPPVWEHLPDATDDSITIPNGRPIYALIVSGYESNRYLDELMVYRFARHLMAQNAYVHYAWWNNLLAPYMERPLHHAQSYPGSLFGDGLNFTSEADADEKAAPGEDYQFVADAMRMLTAIRENNPSAMIIVVGHSMGGGAVVHLGTRTDVVLDILAPIDPVGNRNYPWSGPIDLQGGSPASPDFNWTRWRVSRNGFLGYRSLVRDGFDCVPDGPWLKSVNETNSDLLCRLFYSYHDAPTLVFGREVINLLHRYQQEAIFPFDFPSAYDFGHIAPPGGTTSQEAVPTKSAFCGGTTFCPDPGGWPFVVFPTAGCCTTGDGIGWNSDGHGEILGYRGPLPSPVPLGVRVRTSPQCGECANLVWPSRSNDNGPWENGNGALRRTLLQELQVLPLEATWTHAPVNPNLCLVSSDLIHLFDTMNRPPEAAAGDDQVVECAGPNGTDVVLDASTSSDPDTDTLEYSWTWDSGFATGPTATVSLPKGDYCIKLTVKDPSGHRDEDIVFVKVQDTTPPDLAVGLSPTILWPPNHTMIDIQAAVEAHDLCGEVSDLQLVSISSSDDDDGNGDGHTSNDIDGAEWGTLDTSFRLRAERSGNAGSRVYTVRYRATDESLNQREVSTRVIVMNPHH